MHFLFSPGIFRKHPESLNVRHVERRSCGARSAVQEKMTAERRPLMPTFRRNRTSRCSPGRNRGSSFPSPLVVSDRQSQPEIRTERVAKPLQHTSPAEVVPQILGRHSMESEHPPLQPRVVGIRVLDVKNSHQNPDPLVQVDGPVGNAKLPGRQGQSPFPSPVGDEDRVPVHEGTQHGFNGLMVARRKDRLRGGSRAVADHQHRNLFPGQSPLRGPSSPFSRKPRKRPLSFEGLQEVSLIRFDDPGLVPGHDRLGKGQESMPPVEGRFPVDRATPSHLSDRLPLGHHSHVVEPAVLVAKARQRGLRQRSEGPQTPLTPVAREAGGMTPRPDVGMDAMGASDRDSHQGRDLFLQTFPLRLGEFVPKFFLLGRAQFFLPISNIVGMQVFSWECTPQFKPTPDW